MIHTPKNIEGLFGTKMSNRARDQLNIMFGGLVFYLVDSTIIQAMDLLLCSKLHVDLIHIVDQFLGFLLLHVVGNISANLMAQGKLPITKGTGSGPSTCNSTG